MRDNKSYGSCFWIKIKDVVNLQLGNQIVRTQKLQFCEIALAEGIQKNNPVVIRWFTSEILHFQGSWATGSDVWYMVRRRASDANLETAIGCHTFRATGITDYHTNGGKLEIAQRPKKRLRHAKN